MNAMQMLSSQPWVDRLGWTLVHFLWEGLAIAAVYAAARRKAARTAGPDARYLLACAALAAMLAAPLVTWMFLRPQDAVAVPNNRTAIILPAVSNVAVALPASMRAVVSAEPQSQFLPWVVAIWMGGAAAFWVRLMGGCVVAARMRSMLVRRAPPEWQEALGRLGARVGLYRPVRLLVSALVQVPTVTGWLRPVILIPVGAAGGMQAEYLEALLLHELAHIRRHDYLCNILQGVIEALLFYHPAVWWISGHIRAERELCCDDVAVSASGDVLTYASALAELESYRSPHLRTAVAANGGSLADRIARLLGQSRPAGRRELRPGGLTIAVLLAVAAYGVFGQSAGRAAFEAASVKRNPAVAPRNIIVRPQPGGRFTAENAPLPLLIQDAYGVQAYQVVGGPPWINSEGYDIEAKPEGNTDRKQIWAMLKTLLAERFKLALHRDTRELPVYNLVAAKGGAKLPLPKEGGCISPALDSSTMPPGSGSIPCGRLPVSMLPTVLRLQGSKVPMAELVRTLAMVVGRPVLDKTGLAGEFDVQLEFTPDETTMGMPGFGGPANPAGVQTLTDSDRPNIIAALEQQLGLKLVSTRGPVEVLVIDHVEKPTAN